jgi:hypothetical protein
MMLRFSWICLRELILFISLTEASQLCPVMRKEKGPTLVLQAEIVTLLVLHVVADGDLVCKRHI